MYVSVLCISAILTIARVHGDVSSNTTIPPAIISPDAPVLCTPVLGKSKWCVCKVSTSGMIVDLSSLEPTQPVGAKIKTPRFIDENEGWYIAWSPCSDFDIFTNDILDPSRGDQACKDAGFARFTNLSNKDCHSYGSHKTSAQLKNNGLDGHSRIRLYMKFRYGNSIALIHLVCNEDKEKKDNFKYDGEKDGIQRATLTSKCCCEGGCASSDDGHPDTRINWWIIGGSLSGAFVLGIALVGFIAKRNNWRCNRHLPYPIPVEDNQEDSERLPLIR